MIKKLLLPIAILFYSAVFSTVSSQDLSDIEVQTLPLQNIELSKYGYVVNYTTSQIYQGTFYLPNVWFRPVFPGDTVERNVIGRKEFSYISIDPNPMLKIKYKSGVLSSILVILPSKYKIGGVPYYTGNLEDEALKKNFDEQAGLDYLPFDAFLTKNQ